MSLDIQQDNITKLYNKQYRSGERHDSPEQTRVELVKWFRQRLAIIPAEDLPLHVVNIGSGPQSLEVQIAQTLGRETFNRSLQILTVDIAKLTPQTLLAQKRGYPAVHHVRASGLDVPIAHNLADVVVSNMAMDFIPREDFDAPYQEAYDICKEGGTFVANFHHPDMMENIDKAKGAVRTHWEYLRDNDILFSSEDQIVSCLTRVGFNNISVELHQDTTDKWWFVTAGKPLPA